MTPDYKYQTPSLVKKIFVLEKWADTSPSIFCRELNPWLYFISAVPSCSISLNWRINKKQQAMNSEFLKFLCPLVWKQQFVVCWLVRLCPVGIPWILSVFSFQCLCHTQTHCATLRHTAPPSLAILCSRLKNSFHHWARTSFSSSWVNIILFVKKSPFFLFGLVWDWCPYLM